MIWTLPGLPILAAVLLFALGRRVRRTHLALLVAATELLLLALAIWASITQPAARVAWGAILSPTVGATGIARVMVVLIPAVAVPIVLYAATSSDEDRGRPRLLALLVAFTGAMELLVIAEDFLTLLVGWELVGACSWALIAHYWREAETARAASVAFLTTRAGDLGLYIAAAAALAALPSLEFRHLPALRGTALHVVAAGVLVAAAAKSAQIPFSPWLYRAMKGPTAASALLHSATMVAAGAYLLARLAPVLVQATWLAPAVLWLGLSTALAGGIAALMQRDLKRALAASTSAQYGLMFVAIGAGMPAVAGLHLVTHAFFKALLFLGAGVAMHAAGSLDLASLGLGASLRRIAVLFWVGALALAAVPPLGGAYSKEQVLAAAEHAGALPGALALAAGALSALYAGRIALLAYGTRRGRSKRALYSTPGRAEVLPLTLLAGATLLLSAVWVPAVSNSLTRIMGGSAAPLSLREVAVAVTIVVLATATLIWAWRRDSVNSLGVPAAVQEFAANWFGLEWVVRVFVRRPTLAATSALAAFDDNVLDAGVRGLTRRSIATLTGRLATFDAAIVDAGVHAAARLGRILSGVFARWLERGTDVVVETSAIAAVVIARASRIVDDAGIDALVERVARGIGIAGLHSRRLQSGMAHHYYLGLAAGSLMILAVASWPLWR